ncbi:MAG: FAD-dependent oxidoreductase [Bifidobacteriaceae bacterium]|jgi:thioredoxin reductase (NADPH)|nr:FAD-dependent oxidoreductase [Bifidobacteriaceae bacterium]
MAQNINVENAIVVGSGPAGWTASIYLALAGLNPTLVTGTEHFGGALVYGTHVQNFPGFEDGIAGIDLMDKMKQQSKNLGTNILLDDVTNFDLAGDIKSLTLSDSSVLNAKTVILALGAEYRKLGAKGETQYSGKGVSYCATCDGFFFKAKTVAVIGGGDTALHEALYLSEMCEKVYLIHRRDKFRASDAMQKTVLNNKKIELILNAEVVEFKGNGDVLNALSLKHKNTDGLTEIATSGAFIAIGHTPNTALLTGKLVLDSEGYIKLESDTSLTSAKGVFAGGNAADKRYRQAITAAGAGAKAALDAIAHLQK